MAACASAKETTLPVLTSARELRALPAQEAARLYPVRLRAVVTFLSPEETIFVQDATGGTYLHVQGTGFTAAAGQEIEVTGATYRGLYLTGIVPAALRVLGPAELPAPRAVDFEQLAAGIFNYEWVEVRGTVRAFRATEEGRGMFTMGMGRNRLEVLVNHAVPEQAATLLGANVRVTGLAAGYINARRQLVAPHLRIDDLAALHVERPAPADPFALPLTPVAQLLQFAVAVPPGARTKVRGVVTHHEPGRALFLRDASHGLLVAPGAAEAVRPGDIVEAAGFAEMGAFSADLEDAVVRAVAHGPPPEAVASHAAEIAQGAHDADLVQFEARLLDVRPADGELVLLARADTTSFRARLAGPAGPLAALRAGSDLRLTGIVRVEQPEFPTLRFAARPRSFSLLLRSPEDVVVLHQPSWWTPRRLAVALGSVVALAGAALAWAVALRVRVAAQTAVLRDKVKAESAAEERERIAREFHDTLEQELVGVALRLDAAATKITEPKPRELIEAARRLIQGLQAEARALLRNLRARVLAENSLCEAITLAVAGAGESREIAVRASGEVRRLPGMIEHELLRIAQEATTNAVKHGAAQRIAITLVFAPAEVRLTIEDDGRGFDPEREGAQPGHFGLLGIRERAQKLGGHFVLRSAPGAGAQLAVTVPLSPV